MDRAIQAQIEASLRRIQLLMSASEAHSSKEVQRVFGTICNLVFDKGAYQWLWDEPILLQLDWLFQVKPPEPTTFGNQVAEIRERKTQAQLINDLFFSILNPDASVEKVSEALRNISPIDPFLLNILKSSGRLESIREVEGPPSKRICIFLNFLREDIGLDVANQESVKRCLEALNAREGAGVINTLLVKSSDNSALVMPLQIRVQPGSGRVHCLVHGRKDFEVAFNRARLSLLGHGFLKNSDDIVCTLDLTEPEYLGSSIGLAAAVSIFGAIRGMVIDPYTAFTGDINLDHDHWQIKSVSGVPQKLKAALLAGIRRVFIPRENMNEVASNVEENFQITPVDDLRLYQERLKEIPPKKHNLVYFLNKIGIRPEESIGKFVVKLNEASVVTRYPEELGKLQKDFTRPIVEDILSRSREVLEWIKKQF